MVKTGQVQLIKIPSSSLRKGITVLIQYYVSGNKCYRVKKLTAKDITNLLNKVGNFRLCDLNEVAVVRKEPVHYANPAHSYERFIFYHLIPIQYKTVVEDGLIDKDVIFVDHNIVGYAKIIEKEQSPQDKLFSEIVAFRKEFKDKCISTTHTLNVRDFAILQPKLSKQFSNYSADFKKNNVTLTIRNH